MAIFGIDLHKRESQVAVLPDEPTDDEPLEEVRVLMIPKTFEG